MTDKQKQTLRALRKLLNDNDKVLNEQAIISRLDKIIELLQAAILFIPQKTYAPPIIYKNPLDPDPSILGGWKVTASTAKHEQKPANNIEQGEQKFHEGDWIIHQGTENIYQVVACIDNQYQLKYGDNYTIQKCADVDRYARLWDITKDAKPGDVLVDDVRRRSIIQILEYARSLNTYNVYGKATIDKNIAWLEKQALKPKWTKEDDNKVDDIVYFLNTAKAHYASTEAIDDCVEWLKSIKQRIEQQ